MPFSFLQRGNPGDYASQLRLVAYTPAINLDDLVAGIDNVRHDVFLSPRFSDQARQHIARLIAKYGGVEDLVAEPKVAVRPPSIIGAAPPPRAFDPADFKRHLGELHVAALNRAKAEGNVSLDLLARLAMVKFLRAEMQAQFASLLERCRAKQKSYEGPRSNTTAKAIEIRERAARFQLAKRPVLRKVGQDLFQTLREVEKETLLRMRRSLLGDVAHGSYELFLNRLLFTEDGRDDYLNAEHYVMLGNYAGDCDRLGVILEIMTAFLKSLSFNYEESEYQWLLCAPENAQALVAGGAPDEHHPNAKAQKLVLNAWLEALEHQGVMPRIIAAYETAPLLAEYAPAINPQQLKNALISRDERKRVERLLEEHGKISPENLHQAARRVAGYRAADRAKVAGRFFGDFIRYHRDLRRLETLNAAMDAVNVVATEKLRELSAINNTLYEFLLPEEQKPAEEKVVRHVIVKADIRDSTTLTRTLFERGLNPASYFSLNFYEPVNKLLTKYGASKVFIEGDAVILALFEREGEAGFCVARGCVLAKEIMEIVRAYNAHSQRAGLPNLELGIGISYQDAAPMYLMDGKSPIMISPALNESDRLSSCSRNARRLLAGREGLFNVYCLQAMAQETAGSEEFLMRYNRGGICLSQPAFRQLQSEISLRAANLDLPPLWTGETPRLYHGTVPVGHGVFHQVAVREGRVPCVDARDFSVKQWSDDTYYEVCTNAAVYELIESTAAAALSRR